MKRSHLSALTCFSVVGLSAVLGACKLDLGTPGESAPADKAKTSATDGSAPDGGALVDSGAPDGNASAPTHGDGGAPTADASVLPWSAPAPEGARVTLDVAGDQACSFELAYVVENPGALPQQYTTSLEKKEAAPGSCPEAKGFVILSQHSYADPAGVVRRHATDRIIAVAWNEKANDDVNAPNMMRLAQIDWMTGADLHEGIMTVKGAQPDQPLTSLRPTSMNLSVGYDVILDGTGDFPGATGAGAGFEATWTGFLSTAPQAPAAADSATRQ